MPRVTPRSHLLPRSYQRDDAPSVTTQQDMAIGSARVSDGPPLSPGRSGVGRTRGARLRPGAYQRRTGRGGDARCQCGTSRIRASTNAEPGADRPGSGRRCRVMRDGSRPRTAPTRSPCRMMVSPFIVLLQGRDAQDPLFLQVKEATASVLEANLRKSRYRQHGERVVQGQRLMQAASDIYLGWTKGQDVRRHFYWRQLRDMKGSALVEAMAPVALTFDARVCG